MHRLVRSQATVLCSGHEVVPVQPSRRWPPALVPRLTNLLSGAVASSGRMRRVSIVGSPGSGKTTVSRHLADRLGVAHVELDSIFHQAGWTELAPDEFRRRVGAVVSADGWVVDGNYTTVQDLDWARADTVVWLDLPRRLVMRRVVVRTLRRALTR